MRLVACALSTVLLSGCSWLGIGSGSQGTHQAYEGHNSGQYAKKSAHYGQQQKLGPCQITSPMQAVPQGCRPEQVTLALGNQQASHYGQSGYTDGGYGSHAANASASTRYHTPKQRKKRPLLRGSLGLEIDHSVSGNLYSPSTSLAAAGYNRALFAEGTTTGSVAGGQTTDTVYTSSNARLGRINAPDISFDDVYTAPLRITGGLEMIMSDHATLFANAGYTRAEGKKGGGAEINEELLRTITVTDYNTDPTAGPVGAVTGTTSNTTFIPNETVATFDYEFNELEKVDFEVGGRYYFNPMFRDHLERTVTPFVAASGGAAYYSETTVVENQRQRYLQRAFDGTEMSPTGDYYDVNFGTPTQLYDSQWTPYGQIKGGLEWQMNRKAALAFEAGVKYEGARDFSDGTQGDDIISIPIAIRGSYNF
ncbi:MAG: hypothetical protein EX271_09885 [Acidimicrobiales bacterium]|nr:MAG: hypothetical protein EX271_09885 [Acidimicrobiales bacterium]